MEKVNTNLDEKTFVDIEGYRGRVGPVGEIDAKTSDGMSKEPLTHWSGVRPLGSRPNPMVVKIEEWEIRISIVVD